MRWFKLKHHRCPKCDADLNPRKEGQLIINCSSYCGFAIEPKKLDVLIENLKNKKKLDKEFQEF